MSGQRDASRSQPRGSQHGLIDLRRLDECDVEVLATWALDPEFCAAAEWTAGMSLVEAQRRLRARVLSPPAELLRLGAVLEGRLVGWVDLYGDGTRRELGFLVGGSSHWGQGIGRLVATAGVRFGFEHLGLTAIWAEAVDANARSIRILQGLGMTELGPGDQHTYRGRATFYRRFELSATD